MYIKTHHPSLIKNKQMKTYQKFFLSFFILIFLLQLFYWVFANKAEPIVMGMPFALFFIVFTIVLEFMGLIALYHIDKKQKTNTKP